MMIVNMLLGYLLAVVEAETLTITAGLQTGFFETGADIGSMNPHDYRPNEFVTNDFIYEGLVAWDGDAPNGADGVAGNEDDYVVPSLATSWTTGFSGSSYEITFTLRSGVTFHDGSAWNAAAAKGNFDQIMGGDGSLGGAKAMKGMHDWLGFTQSLDGWSVVDDMTFKLTFATYYEAALRELTYIRPFRMISLASLPNMADMRLSHNAWRGGAPRVFSGYTMSGVSNPIGTGPYKVIDKLLVKADGSQRRLPAAEFNASCYVNDQCVYEEGETVSEVLFQKHDGHWKNPSYDNVIFKSYDSLNAIRDALQDGTLDITYGVNTLSPSSFIHLATAEGGAGVTAHMASTDLNTRLLVLNSGGRLDSIDKRKLVMGILTSARQALYDGELASEDPMDTLFDPALPHCSVLSTLSSSEDLAATKSSDVTVESITEPLRFIYIKDIPHQQIIAAEVIATLYTHGIDVEPMPVTKDEYNARHCDYLGDPDGGFPYYYSYTEGDPADNYHSWDIAYSETWGPPYDATSKLWDMTHGLAGWCSAEADAVAVSSMETMEYSVFVDKVRSLSTTEDATERENKYSEVLTTLHDEAIFLPLTAKLQTAVTSDNVAGFKFGFMEYDLPLANLSPMTLSDAAVSHFLLAIVVSLAAAIGL